MDTWQICIEKARDICHLIPVPTSVDFVDVRRTFQNLHLIDSTVPFSSNYLDLQNLRTMAPYATSDSPSASAREVDAPVASLSPTES